jgi:hypothetical protein
LQDVTPRPWRRESDWLGLMLAEVEGATEQ